MATGRKEIRRRINLIILLMSVGNFVLHIAVSGNWELHRDAYLYLNLADHPAWGYISVPPFIMVLATMVVKLFGGSTFVVRLLPALAGAIATTYVGVITKDLGGKRWAVLLATLTYALSPAFLRMGSMFQPATFNQFFWVVFFYLFVQMLRSKNLNYWYVIGFVVGLGMLNKYIILVPLVTVIIGLLVARKWSMMLCRQFWIGLVTILIMVLPNLIWQHNHNWPVTYHMGQLNQMQLVHIDAIHFSNMQFLMNSHGLIIWILGLVAILFYKPFKPFRPVGYAFLAMWLMLILMGGKPYYMLGIYPILFVFGALIVEFKTKKMEWVRPVITSFVAIVALFLLPLSLPFFRVETMIGYGKVLKDMEIVSPYKWKDGSYHELPEDFANMRGWKGWASLAKDAYNSLSEEEKAKVVIFGDNYGLVGASNYYNRKHNMPEGHSFEGSYMFWTPEVLPENCVMIYLGSPTEEFSRGFLNKELFGTLNVEHAKEFGTEIYILRDPVKGYQEKYSTYRKNVLQPFFRKPL